MFCDACGRNSSFAVMNRTRTFNIKGMDIQVPYRTEICINCGEERYNDELEMSIMEKAITMYRDKQKMLPAEQIMGYMRRHEISAEEMAKRAGCAVGDILRAKKGRLVDVEADRKLKQVICA
jgi:hypothetical protein